MNAPEIWGDDDESVFADLLDTVAPEAADLVVLINSFFDESYNPKLLCVAGYTFRSQNSRLLDRDWRKMLARYRLPYFRMSACNAGKPPFDHLTETQCVAVATEAIALINKYAAFGNAVTVEQEAFNKVVTPKGFVSTPYELCAWFCRVEVKTQVDKRYPNGKLAFFFESGFQHDGVANRTMNRIFSAPKLRQAYRYRSHSFVDKADSCPTQAADLLAWQWYEDFIRGQNGATKHRGDLTALLQGTQHYMLHSNEARLKHLIEMINAKAGTPIGNEIAGLAITNPSHPVLPQRRGPSGEWVPGDAAALEKMKKDYPERF